jgi:signal peptide peptidase-like protein 2B
MEMGQPALLYLVPCCLGTMVCMGRRAGELADLWEGPRAIRAADALMYGETHVESAAETEDRDDQDLALEESMVNEEAEMT